MKLSAFKFMAKKWRANEKPIQVNQNGRGHRLARWRYKFTRFLSYNARQSSHSPTIVILNRKMCRLKNPALDFILNNYYEALTLTNKY